MPKNYLSTFRSPSNIRMVVRQQASRNSNQIAAEDTKIIRKKKTAERRVKVVRAVSNGCATTNIRIWNRDHNKYVYKQIDCAFREWLKSKMSAGILTQPPTHPSTHKDGYVFRSINLVCRQLAPSCHSHMLCIKHTQWQAVMTHIWMAYTALTRTHTRRFAGIQLSNSMPN